MNYWIKREQKAMRERKRGDKEMSKAIQSKYNDTMAELDNQINAFYAKYAEDEGITMKEARKRADRVDIKAYGKKAERYVKGAHSGNEFIAAQSFTPQANAEMKLYNLTMKANRLELLKANLQLELTAMTNDIEHYLLEKFTKSAIEEFTRQSGILGMTVTGKESSVRALVNASYHNATWSERLWANQSALRNEVDTLVTRSIMQGKNPRQMARELRKSIKSGVYESERLMITEVARIQIDVQMDSFKQAGLDEYVFITEPDACHLCKPHDGKVFKKGEFEVLRHPNCRCSFSVNIDRDEWEKRMKAKGL